MSNDGLRHRRGRLKASVYLVVFGVGDGDGDGDEDEHGSKKASGDPPSNR